MTIPLLPAGTSRESFFTSSPARPKIAWRSFFGSQFGLALGADLADQDVARPDPGTLADDSGVVEVLQLLLGDVWNVIGEFLATKLGVADFHVEGFDVDRCQDIVLDQSFGDDDRILEVVAVEGVEGDQGILADGQLAVLRRGTVRENLASLDFLAQGDDRTVLLAGPFVELAMRFEQVLVGVVDDHPLGVDVGDFATTTGLDDHAGEFAGDAFHSGGHQWWIGLEQRDRLSLHVRTHQCTVGVVMLEEGDHGCRDTHDLLGGDVDVLDLLGRDHAQVAIEASEHLRVADAALLVEHVRGGQDGGHLPDRPEAARRRR